MATPEVNTQQLQDEALTLRPEEKLRLKKRRQDVKDYDPPKWTSSQPDPVSGQLIERPMVPHASILHLPAPHRASLLSLSDFFSSYDSTETSPPIISLTKDSLPRYCVYRSHWLREVKSHR